MKRTLILSLALLSLAFSCKKRNVYINPDPTGTDTAIYGKWKWIATYDDGAPSATNPQTPQNSGNVEVLTFNTNGTWTDVLNNSTVGSGIFNTGKSAEYDSVNFGGNVPGWAFNKYYSFSHDTISFGNPFSIGSGAKLWVME